MSKKNFRRLAKKLHNAVLKTAAVIAFLSLVISCLAVDADNANISAIIVTVAASITYLALFAKANEAKEDEGKLMRHILVSIEKAEVRKKYRRLASARRLAREN